MVNKLLVLVGVTVASIALTGCELQCKRAYKHESKVDLVTNMATDATKDSSKLDTACAFMNEEGSKILTKTSKFAERAAYRKFYYEETKCVAGYWTIRCDYGYGRYPRHPHYPYPPAPGRCYDYYQCTRYETKTHKLDGFEDAMYVSDALKRVNTELNIACLKNSQGDKTSALKGFMNGSSMLSGDIKLKSKTAIIKAGCSAVVEDDVYSSVGDDTETETDQESL